MCCALTAATRLHIIVRVAVAKALARYIPIIYCHMCHCRIAVITVCAALKTEPFLHTSHTCIPLDFQLLLQPLCVFTRGTVYSQQPTCSVHYMHPISALIHHWLLPVSCYAQMPAHNRGQHNAVPALSIEGSFFWEVVGVLFSSQKTNTDTVVVFSGVVTPSRPICIV